MRDDQAIAGFQQATRNAEPSIAKLEKGDQEHVIGNEISSKQQAWWLSRSVEGNRQGERLR